MVGSVFWIINGKDIIPQTNKNVDPPRNEPDFSK